MTNTLAHGLRAVDPSIYPRWEVGASGEQGVGFGSLFRDADSKRYLHPAQHFFKDAPERLEKFATPEETIALMDEFGVQTAFVMVDPSQAGPMLKIMERFPGRLYGRLSVDPMQGMDALRAIDAVARGNPFIKALAITPFAVQRPPNDKVYYPIYAKAIELDLPVTMTVGLPGPRVPGECQNPMYLDEPLWFFPDLKIVMMHGGEPWEALCVKLMLKWPNLYYMTSAFVPKHYPKAVIHYANTRGAHKVMFAGYYPGISYERLKGDLQNLQLREQVWPRFLRENAIEVFKLDNL
ncbi:MAG: amidohydrolase family protein [Gammaproteobacteria bacterium]